MILGIGVDAVSIERVKTLSPKALQKMFRPSELEEYSKLETAQEDIRAQFLASRFAVKEAYSKARGKGFDGTVVPNEITTSKEKDGRPYVVLSGKTLDNAPRAVIHLSLTHEKPLAIAMVVLESIEAEDEGGV